MGHEAAVRRVLPNAKELLRSDGHVAVVVRPDQQAGGYAVSLVLLATGEAWGGTRGGVPQGDVSRAVRDGLRMLDKCGHASPMAGASRHRK